MSQENVELTRRAFEAFNSGDLDALLALMDEDVEATPRLAAMEGVYHGHEGIRRWWKGLLDVFPDFTVEVLEVRDLGDLTFAAAHARGHGAGSHTPLDDKVWHSGHWRDGKCVQWRLHNSESEALEAVGMVG